MKKLILALILISNYQVFSQTPILDSANFSPKAGDTIYSWNGNLNNYFNPGASGANVYWDFSTINFTIPVSNPSQLFYIVYKNVNAYNSNIGTAYHPVEGTTTWCYNNYLSQMNSFSHREYYCIGAGAAGGFMYSSNKKMITYPFTYQSYYSDSTIIGTMNYPYGNNFHSHIYYDIVCDGWGTLKILNKIHLNVLRIRYNNYSLDSSQTTILRIDTSYSWYKPNSFSSLLGMSTIWSNDNGTWTNTKTTYITPYGLDYTPAFLGVTDFDKESINIYPNPATDFLQIENISDKTIISIYSMDGKLQKSLTVAENGIVKIKELAEGIYIIKLQTEKGIIYRKFIKQ